MNFTDKFNAKYFNPTKKCQNLPTIEHKKASLAECRSCSQFEEGPDSVGENVGKVFWCVTKYFDRIKKRPVICYRNIELLSECPKKSDRKR